MTIRTPTPGAITMIGHRLREIIVDDRVLSVLGDSLRAMETMSKLLGLVPIKFLVNLAAACTVLLAIVSISRDYSLSVLQTVGSGLRTVGANASFVDTAHRDLIGFRWPWWLVLALVLVALGTGFGVATAIHWHDGVRAPAMSWGTYIATFGFAVATDIADAGGLLAAATIMAAVGLLGARVERDMEVAALGFCPLYVPFCVLWSFARPRFIPTIDDF